MRMSLDEDTDERRVLELLQFIRQHEFLYARLNVEFFSAKIYEQIDIEWLNFMASLPMDQLNRLPIDFGKYSDCPPSLARFFSTASSCSLLADYATKFIPVQPSDNHFGSPPKLTRVKPKKAHELAVFGQFIRAECERANVDRIVDIGCGLGHLGRFLEKSNSKNEAAGTPIEYVGIEANPEFCHSGQRICGDGLQIENIRFGAETIDQCRQIFADKAHRTAIVSLHGCGELQPLILREFAKLARECPGECPLLITIGCCYHKVKDWENTAIDRWMLSRKMLRLFKRIYGRTAGFPIPGLRLGCQAKLARWAVFTEQEHRRHQRAFSNRAFVECLKAKMGEYGTNWAERPRKLNRKLGTSDEEFRREVIRRSGCPPEGQSHCEALLDAIIDAHSHTLPNIQPFVALQFALQAPLESLVLLDRLFYLRECPGMDAQLVELFDPVISPRNVCIVARVGNE